ncbi:MAG TPA: FtsX-like permease family protein [Pirellulaceae bacterium]|nr:FtsX-like permease family protein [Pirellulaceae bacterium]
MKIRDISGMAFHNLWTRKFRTAMNLLGVVISSILLILTFAGTRGASIGLQSIINESEDVRKMTIRPSYEPDIQVPEEALVVDGEMSDERRERICERRRQEWLVENGYIREMDQDDLEQLRTIEGVREVVPTTLLQCQMTLAPLAADSKDVAKKQDVLALSGFTRGISLLDAQLKPRIIAGGTLHESETDGVLISEYTAYQLGFHSDRQLQELVGLKLKVEYQVGGNQVSWFLQSLKSDLVEGTVGEQAEVLSAIKRLIDDIEATKLTDREKELIQEAFQIGVSTEQSAVLITEEFVIRGVFRPTTSDDIFSFLRTIYTQDDMDLYVHHRTATRINVVRDDFRGFWGAMVTIEDVSDLRRIVDRLESLGYYAHSAIRIVESVDREINKVKMAISALAVIILFIAALGISNTMMISVLERTPEFGIMKSLGAKDSHVLTLMLCEGMLTGLLGSAFALLLSGGLSWIISLSVRRYIENRIGQQYGADIFVYSPLDIAMVLAVGSLVCSVASFLPAWRAASVDPIVAMQRK